jgi:class 3 adenylate cyclase
VLTLAHADRERDDDSSDTRVLRFPGMLDRANRTFICTVLFLDIVEYSKKPVSEQLKIKEQFNTLISAAIEDIAVNDRIILDTGDGVAVNFLGDPEDALFVAMNLARAFASVSEGEPRVDVRIGINLGPVRLVRDINGQPNIIGDGINVAERVMSFARPGQVLVSRSYYEVVTRISEDYAQLFAYQGSRTDKHVREHEIYEVASGGDEALDLATRRHRARPAGRPALVDLAESTQMLSAEETPTRWFSNRALAYGVAGLSGAALVIALAFYAIEPASETAAVSTPKRSAKVEAKPEEPAPTLVAAATVADAPPAETVKPPEPPKPVSRKESTHRKPRADKAALREEPTDPGSGKEVPEVAKPVNGTQDKPAVTDPPAPAHAAPKAPSGPTALVTLAVSPWGEVLVDGRSMGVSPPMAELELAPGRYRIEIRNGEFKPYQEMFELEPNQTIRIKHKFR